jgi:hypothetical protein
VQETILRAIYTTCAADISRAAFSGLRFWCSRAVNVARINRSCARLRADSPNSMGSEVDRTIEVIF